MIFLGLDIGSSGCKCVAFDSMGQTLGSASREYSKALGQIGLMADDLFSHVCAVIAGCARQLKNNSDIVSLTVSSFGESFVPVNKDGKAISPIAMYTDGWGAEEAVKLEKTVPNISKIVGAKPNPMYALPKMMHMLDRQLEVKNTVWKFLQIADYITYRLCGETVLDYSLACRSLAFDIKNLNWSETVLAASGISSEMLSTPVPTGSVAGTIHSVIADSLGLPSHAKIIVGAHDQVASAIGAGALTSGQAVVGTGSVECITPVFDRLILDDDFLTANYVCIPHAVKGQYVTYAFTMSGGSLLAWYRDKMVPHLKPIAEAQGRSVYDLLNETCPSKPSELIIVPHWGGTGTPELNPLALGKMVGFSKNTGLPEIYRAIMEGLCFELCYNRDQIKRSGIEFSSLKATGGGAKSPLWLQLKADILGVPVTSIETSDAGAVGGAMLAAVTFGAFDSLAEAAKVFTKIKQTYEPNIALHTIYEEKYMKYTELRGATI